MYSDLFAQSKNCDKIFTCICKKKIWLNESTCNYKFLEFSTAKY